MELYVTRDSVAMGDDGDAPHERRFSYPDATAIEDVIERIVASGYLASIQGGRATWSVVSGLPIAVVAQQWKKPRAVQWEPVKASSLQSRNGVVGLHFNYHAQVEPDVVLDVLKRLRLNVFV
jgi:hypothetical protein